MRLRIILLVAAVIVPLPRLAAASAAIAERQSIPVAVLPFRQLTARADDQYLGDGFAETLTTALSRVAGLQLVERGQLKQVLAEQRLQNSGIVDPAAAVKVGELTGARQLVLGSFQRAGAEMRVTCRIVDTRTGVAESQHTIVETLRLDRGEDLFALQDAVCAALLKTFGVHPTPQEQQLVAQVINATSKRTAYDCYIQAREQYLLFTTVGYAKAVPLYEKALELDPGYVLAYAGLAETLSRWGIQKEQNGDDPLPAYRRALDLAKKAVVLAPDSGDVHRALAQAYSHLGETGTDDPEKASRCEQAARKAIAQNPLDAEAYHVLWIALGMPVEGDGYSYIRKALEIAPGLSVAWNNLGAALRSHRRPREALAAIRKAIELSPRNDVYYRNLSRALWLQGKRDEAIAACRKATEVNPGAPSGYLGLGLVLRDAGRTDEAITAFRTAVAANPRFVEAYHDLGQALNRQGKREEALAIYQTAVTLNPRDPAAYYRLGAFLNGMGKPALAVDVYRKAIEIDPSRERAYHNLGGILDSQAKEVEAEAAFRKALEINPMYAYSYFGLGGALKEQGKRQDAIAALREFIRLSSNPQMRKKEWIPKAEALIKELGG